MKLWLAGALLCVLACSSSSTMKEEQLMSEMTQLRSLEAEVRLFEQLAERGQLTSGFARGHAHYLHETAQEHAKKLAAASPAPGFEEEFRRIQAGFSAVLAHLQ
ncbi:MAG TPA: hypothetical protein VG454_11265 [Gemmatimonadales bacterium]|nr:hypothetical protein [Gemmatimonadales bacterium]